MYEELRTYMAFSSGRERTYRINDLANYPDSDSTFQIPYTLILRNTFNTAIKFIRAYHVPHHVSVA